MEAANVEKTLRGLVNRAWEIWVEHANASVVKR